jgi:hypothetical protein
VKQTELAEEEKAQLQTAVDTEKQRGVDLKAELTSLIASIKSKNNDAAKAAQAAEEQEKARVAEAERLRKEREKKKEDNQTRRDHQAKDDPGALKYEQLLRSCKASGSKFEDAEFPPSMSSLYIKPGYITKGQQFTVRDWKRISDYTQGCQVTTNGFDPDDLCQGELGDCWFICSMSIVATQEQYMPKLISGDPEVGIYAVKFNGRKDASGRAITVIVDDRLPHKYETMPLFCQARDKKEMWPSIVEKAYAKLHGSYEAIVGGRVDDGVADMVNGIQGYIDLHDLGAAASDGTLWHKLKSGLSAGYLMGAGSHSGSDTDTVHGIVQGHAYSILGVQEVSNNGQREQLLCMRNPWGSTEWEFEWSDAWINQNASASVKRQLKWTSADDGIFWIKLPDFLLEFATVYTVRVFNQSWKQKALWGEWKGSSAAGCGNFRNIQSNPQFLVSVSKPAHIIIMLSQIDEEGQGRDHTSIGAQLLDIGGKRATRNIREVITTGSFSNIRAVTLETERLEPSTRNSGKPYTLVVSTFYPGPQYNNGDAKNERKFALNCYCDDQAFDIQELVD